MGQEYDVHDESSSGAAFVTGLCAGAVIGAGLALLFAPRPGSELREQISSAAATARDTVSKSIDELSDRGRQAYDRARDTISKAGDAVDRTADAANRNLNAVIEETARGSRRAEARS